MASMAENQQRIQSLLQDAQFQRARLEQAGATLATAKNRIESLATMLENARGLLQYPVKDREEAFDLACKAARDEVRYWLTAYVETLPKMYLARDTMLALQNQVDVVQEEYHAQIVEFEAGKAAKTQGAIGNPPGASPSVDLRA